MGEEFEWSVIDRWPTHDGFLTALTDRVQKGLDDFDEEDRDKVVSFKKKQKKNQKKKKIINLQEMYMYCAIRFKTQLNTMLYGQKV